MTPTERYIKKLESLQEGDLGLLRAHGGQRLDHTVPGFDLFTGLWWPIRQGKQGQRAPRRHVAWLIATLYASCPLEQESGKTLARQLRRCHQRLAKESAERFQQRFDRLLSLPLADLGPALRWALGQVSTAGQVLDWVKLTDDLSVWERPSKRLEWAEQFLGD